MKLSINNFKSIKSLVDYELKPLTILSGINSSGKSSFIQLFLLLKETIDLDSSKFLLYLKGELFDVKNYQDIIYKKDLSNFLKVVFNLSKKDFEKFGDKVKKSLYDSFDEYQCQLEITFKLKDHDVYISDFILNYNLPEGGKKDQFVKFHQAKEGKTHCYVESNVSSFGNALWTDKPDSFNSINYSSIFPISYETYKESIQLGPKGDTISDGIIEIEYPKIESIKSFMKAFFEELYYIGPLREMPKDEYLMKSTINSVGSKGQYVAQFLELNKDEIIEISIPTFNETVAYHKDEMTLLNGVKFWFCDTFKICKDIYTKKIGESYVICLVNFDDVELTIKHVGFGISQILPIIVQGLIMSKTGTLILEQPEIHLHPKVQSLMFDFIYSLTLLGKSIIVETHSDHFITRMRRRIAEDETNFIKEKVNLTFIESGKNGVLFKDIPLDDYGSSNYFPEDFIEKNDVELSAIVKAQMKKRLSKK